MRHTLLIGSSLLMVLTALVVALACRRPAQAVGADRQAEVVCGKCGYIEHLPFDQVFARGTLSTERGWIMPCPRCNASVAVHASEPVP